MSPDQNEFDAKKCVEASREKNGEAPVEVWLAFGGDVWAFHDFHGDLWMSVVFMEIYLH